MNINFIQRQDRKSQFIFAGRLDKTKGINKLLISWKTLSSLYNNDNFPTLLICGGGPEEYWCKEFIKKNCLENAVQLLGFMDNRKTINMIAESLALILPTQWYEGFPMTIIEAYGCGTPVLGSNVGNVASVVIDGVNGYTFDRESPSAIAEAVQKVLLETKGNLDLYRSTFEYYQSHYTSEENYKLLNGIYKNVIGK